ncbi:MAG: hypothetical protein WCK82_00335 [Bacteroidota bacterium]|jgi:hypothetical protein
MDLKTKIRCVLKKQYGKFETILEHQYEDKLTENLIEGPLSKRKEWATYNQVVLELKHSLKDMLRVKELQYKLTDDGDPNEIIIEAIEEVKTFTPELERLYYKIKNF